MRTNLFEVNMNGIRYAGLTMISRSGHAVTASLPASFHPPTQPRREVVPSSKPRTTKTTATTTSTTTRKVAARPATKAATTRTTTTKRPRSTSAPAPSVVSVFTHQDVALRAHDLYVRSGHEGHRHVEFWLEAERQLRDGVSFD